MSSAKESTSSSSSSSQFRDGDLVFAKMRSFPPWPAKILPSDNAGGPSGKVGVVFFGTRETAFLRRTELFPYHDYRHQFEIPRKNKGFNEGVHEIRVAAGLVNAQDPADPLFTRAARPNEPPVAAPSMQTRRHSTSSSKTFSNRDKESISLTTTSKEASQQQQQHQKLELPIFHDEPTLSTSFGPPPARSRTFSNSSRLFRTKDGRRRLGSESSNGSRKNPILRSDDPFPYMGNLLDVGVEGQTGTGGGGSRKSTKEYARAFNDLFPELDDYDGPRRRSSRSGGSESGRRHRLISGYTELMLEDMFRNEVESFYPLTEPIDDIDDEVRSVTHRSRVSTSRSIAPAEPPSGPPKHCAECNSICVLAYGTKWRCPNQICLTWWNDTAVEPKPADPKPGYDALRNLLTLNPAKSPELKEDRVVKKDLSRVAAKPVPRHKSGRPTKAEAEARKRLEVEAALLAAPLLPEDRMDPNDSSGRRRSSRQKERVARISPEPTTGSPRKPEKFRPAPKTRVEFTPLIGECGRRECTHCGGPVRPQKCGGQKHRWRCVQKHCRKWYGWVKDTDEIPSDLMSPTIRRIKEAAGGDEMKVILGAHLRADALRESVARLANPKDDKKETTGGEDEKKAAEHKKKRPPSGGTIKLQLVKRTKPEPEDEAKEVKKEVDEIEAAAASICPPDQAPKTEKGKEEANNGKKRVRPSRTKTTSMEEKDGKMRKRTLSPLPPEIADFKPSALERKSRWWLLERRPTPGGAANSETSQLAKPTSAAAAEDEKPAKNGDDTTNPRQPATGLASDAAAISATFRVMAGAMRAAANTKADEPGSVTGATDLMMDALFGALGAFGALATRHLPTLENETEEADGARREELEEAFWRATAAHTPIFH